MKYLMFRGDVYECIFLNYKYFDYSVGLSHRTYTQACINIASNSLPVCIRHKHWPFNQSSNQ